MYILDTWQRMDDYLKIAIDAIAFCIRGKVGG